MNKIKNIKQLIMCCLMCTCILTTQAQLLKKMKSQFKDKAKQKAVTATNANKILLATLPGINLLKKMPHHHQL
ncbi:MAG: hypothetical protein H0W12_10085 [Chitinophagaceae bacterium]|nr:hypothetical protein [Chitinophagaceae bacterium]